jgi:hypothetical protein
MSPLTFFRARLNDEQFAFSETLAFIAEHYDYRPTAFSNGGVENAAGQNEGSCKILGLALLEGLSEQQTLQCFGEHYRSVLGNPTGHDHANIRALISHGLARVHFQQGPLKAKKR